MNILRVRVKKILKKGATVDSHLEHRVAMSCAIAALVAEGETTILDSDCVAI